ncbi:EF-hand domain-containing protein [Sphingomonas sp. URHD0057]|uniref:EF-hand domain-containing protein n=1 Tax=Sphingomonas sp. URHD0057 TaxID=1380389 RepID=UPI00068681B7|nr:EF-hand domain-containing protein [Sphingomonas sp. URHD0057]
MFVSALFLPLLAAGIATPSSRDPIVVKGHAWAPFISPMGEPFRARSADDDSLVRWFNQADRNRDGSLSPDEMRADADRFFATLDSDRDGEIDPVELAQYEWEVAPDIQVMSRTRPPPGQAPAKARPTAGPGGEEEVRSYYPHGLQGAARYAVLNLPEPVAAADVNFDRSITLNEFRQAAAERFQLLDGSRAGSLNLSQLQSMRLSLSTSKRKYDDPDARIGSPLPPGN